MLWSINCFVSSGSNKYRLETDDGTLDHFPKKTMSFVCKKGCAWWTPQILSSKWVGDTDPWIWAVRFGQKLGALWISTCHSSQLRWQVLPQNATDKAEWLAPYCQSSEKSGGYMRTKSFSSTNTYGYKTPLPNYPTPHQMSSASWESGSDCQFWLVGLPADIFTSYRIMDTRPVEEVREPH